MPPTLGEKRLSTSTNSSDSETIATAMIKKTKLSNLAGNPTKVEPVLLPKPHIHHEVYQIDSDSSVDTRSPASHMEAETSNIPAKASPSVISVDSDSSIDAFASPLEDTDGDEVMKSQIIPLPRFQVGPPDLHAVRPSLEQKNMQKYKKEFIPVSVASLKRVLADEDESLDNVPLKRKSRREVSAEVPPPPDAFPFKWEYGFRVGDIVWSIEKNSDNEQVLWPCIIRKKTLTTSSVIEHIGLDEVIKIPTFSGNRRRKAKNGMSPSKSPPKLSPLKTNVAVIIPGGSPFKKKDDVHSSSESSVESDPDTVYIIPKISSSSQSTGYKVVPTVRASLKNRFNLLKKHRYVYEVSLYPSKDSQSAKPRTENRIDSRLLPFGYSKSRPSEDIIHNVSLIQAIEMASTWAVPPAPVIAPAPLVSIGNRTKWEPIVSTYPPLLSSNTGIPSRIFGAKFSTPVFVEENCDVHKFHSLLAGEGISHKFSLDATQKFPPTARMNVPYANPQPPFPATQITYRSLEIFRLGSEIIHAGDIVRVVNSRRTHFFYIHSMTHCLSSTADSVKLVGEYVQPFNPPAVDGPMLGRPAVDLYWTLGRDSTIDAKKVVGRYYPRFHEMFGRPLDKVRVGWDGKPVYNKKRRVQIDWDEYDGKLS
jgi:hypothetical protein